MLVPVASTCCNLQRLALAVSAGSAVLLEGPVGSGKTSLVECLAASVGRTSSPHLLKIQLGDQMDSKVFLLFNASVLFKDDLLGLSQLCRYIQAYSVLL